MERTTLTNREYMRYKLSFIAVFVVNLLFIALTVLAMFFYPGGTQDDESVMGYSVWENFFSDAGRTVSLSGEPNTVSFLLCTTALFLVGLVMIAWFSAVPVLYTSSPAAKFLSRSAVVFGSLAGLSFIGVSFTPSNLFMDIHMGFVYSGFICFTTAFLLLTIAMFQEKGYPRIYPRTLIAFLAILLLYIYLAMARPVFGGFSSLAIQATSQKIIVYTMIIFSIHQSYGALKVFKGKYSGVM